MRTHEPEGPDNRGRSVSPGVSPGGDGGRPTGGAAERAASAAPEDDVQVRLERALGIPPGSGCVAVAGQAAADERGSKDSPRGAAAASRRPGASTRDPAAGRWRIPAGLLVVAALGIAYVVVTRLDRAPAARTSQRSAATSFDAFRSAAVAEPSDPAEVLLARLPDAWQTSCRVSPGLDAVAAGAITCTPREAKLARVEMRVFRNPDQMRERYNALVAQHVASPRAGRPRCASGRGEERGWSLAESPRLAAGRYACRVDAGAATMWWTADASRLLVHAVRADADLAALFEWWRSDASQLLG